MLRAIRSRRWLLLVLAAILLGGACLQPCLAADKAKPTEKVYVWTFQSNLQDQKLVDEITDEFETALQESGRYDLVDRRMLARLLSRRNNEVTDMSNLGTGDAQLLQGKGAQAVFFGNIFNDADSGLVRITVTL